MVERSHELNVCLCASQSGKLQQIYKLSDLGGDIVQTRTRE